MLARLETCDVVSKRPDSQEHTTVMSCHVMSCHVMSCHVMSCQHLDPACHVDVKQVQQKAKLQHVSVSKTSSEQIIEPSVELVIGLSLLETAHLYTRCNDRPKPCALLSLNAASCEEDQSES